MNGPPESRDVGEERSDRIITEILLRLDRGDQIDRQRLFEEYPDIADELRSFFETEELVERMAGPANDSDADSKQSIDTAKGSSSGETVPPNRSVVSREGDSTSTGESVTGTTIGRYHVERILGQGAMGVVYLARDDELHRQVALKIPKFKDDDEPEVIERFYREARSAAALNHRNICPLFDIGESDGIRYITMAYIDGRPLSDFVDADKPPPARPIASTIRKLALAMEDAHQQGVIHRDLKPSNILIDRKREPVIMDFGLARQINKTEDARITQSGALIGSPAYMSPEQVEGELDTIGPASDIYSLGVILYELLTGQLPFRGSIAAVVGQIMTIEPKEPSELRPGVDPQLEAICLKMMAKSIDGRYASMKWVADALTGYLKAAPHDSDSVIAEAELVLDDVPVAEVAEPVVEAAEPVAEVAELVEPSRRSRTNGEREQAESLFHTAKKCLRIHDYEQALEIFAQIPAGHVTPEMQSLYERTQQRQDETDYLIADIEDSVSRNNYDDSLPRVERLLKLKPGHHRGKELHAKLTAAGQRRDRIPVMLNLGPMGRYGVPGWAVWTATAAFTAAVVFGVVTFFLKTEYGLVKVEIHDEAITATIDGETVTFDNSGEPIKVKTGGKHLLIERDGLEVPAHDFTLKKDGQVVLHVWLENNAVRVSDTWTDAAKESFPSAPKEPRSTTLPLVQTGELRANMFPIRFSRDGRNILGVAWGPNLRLAVFDVASGGRVQLADQGWGNTKNGGFPTALAVSPTDSLAVGASSKGRLMLWNQDTGKLQHDLAGHTKAIREVVFTPDGKRILSSSEDGTIRIWNAASGVQERLFDSTSGVTNCEALAVSPDGRFFAEGVHGHLSYRDFPSGGVLWSETYKPDSLLRECAFTSDGRRLATIADGTNRHLTIHDASDGRVIRTISDLPASLGIPVNVRFLADDRLLMSVQVIPEAPDRRASLLLWDVETGRLLQDIDGTQTADVSPDGSTVVTKGSELIARVWSLQKKYLPSSKQVAPKEIHRIEQTASVSALAFTRDGKKLVSGNFGNSIRIWDVETGRELASIETPPNGRSLTLSPDGRHVAWCGKGGQAGIWELETGALIHRLKSDLGDWGIMSKIEYSPDGKLVAANCWDWKARIWDAATGKELQRITIKGDNDNTFDLHFTPDSKHLVVGHFHVPNGLTQVFDVASGRMLKNFDLGKRSAGTGVFDISPDGRRFLIGTFRGRAIEYDLETGRRIGECPKGLADTSTVAYSPNSRWIAVGHFRGHVQLVDATTRMEKYLLRHEEAVISGLAFSPDGRYLATSTSQFGEQTGALDIRIWRLPESNGSDANAAPVTQSVDAPRTPLPDGPPGANR